MNMVKLIKTPLHDLPHSIRTVPMSTEDEKEACTDPFDFFFNDLPNRPVPGQYRFRSRGPRSVRSDDLLLFHFDGQVVADARLLEVHRETAEERTDEYSGYLKIDCGTARVFLPRISHDEFRAIWPDKRMSQTWNFLSTDGFLAWEALVKARSAPRWGVGPR
jgi:hypothetical protein